MYCLIPNEVILPLYHPLLILPMYFKELAVIESLLCELSQSYFTLTLITQKKAKTITILTLQMKMLMFRKSK